MAGRTPKLNWTPCLGQYTTCIRGRRYRLGTDEELDPNPIFRMIADLWLGHVEKTYSPERFRLCHARLKEFRDFIGRGTRIRELRPSHVEQWLASKPKAGKPGTQRLYKAMILAPLNWAAKAKEKGGGGLIPRNPLKGQLNLGPEVGTETLTERSRGSHPALKASVNRPSVDYLPRKKIRQSTARGILQAVVFINRQALRQPLRDRNQIVVEDAAGFAPGGSSE